MPTRIREISGQPRVEKRPVENPSTASRRRLDRDRTALAEGLASLGHDLKSPLTAMKCCLGLVLSEDPGPLNPEQRQFLQRVLRQAGAMQRLVNDALDPAVLMEGQVRVRARDLDLGPVIRDAVAMALAAGPYRERTVDLAGVPDSVMAYADGDLVTRILGNLVGNALKFTPAAGQVRVCWAAGATPSEPVAGRLAPWAEPGVDVGHLIVTDDGPGLPAGFDDLAFEPFRRGPQGPAGPTEGWGLGLTIARRLAEAQAGHLCVERRPGPGSAFRLELPGNQATAGFLTAARRFGQVLTDLQTAGTAPVVGLIDWRCLGADAAVAGVRIRRWLGEARPLVAADTELQPGLLACAVADARALNRRWNLAGRFQVADGDSLDWRFLEVNPSTSAEPGRILGEDHALDRDRSRTHGG
jgi:signal transduction histidine kinase